jgi:hypothetical protein
LSKPEQTVIDDLIVLGRAVPETIKNGRTTICTAGHSKSLGFVRIYPTKHTSPLTQWSIVKVPVERDPRDTRRESWKIQGSKYEWDTLDKKIECVGKLEREDRLNLIANLADGCIRHVNDEKRSLGIVKPTIEERYFSNTADYDPSIQTTLFGPPPPKSKSQYPKIPRIRFRCSDCKAEKSHDMTVLEWGFYEWLRKNPDNIEQVWENALLDSPDHEIFFLLGNMLRYRNAFLIISVLRLPKGSVSKPLVPLKK